MGHLRAVHLICFGRHIVAVAHTAEDHILTTDRVPSVVFTLHGEGVYSLLVTLRDPIIFLCQGNFLRFQNVSVGDDLNRLRFALPSRTTLNSEVVTSLLVIYTVVTGDLVIILR